MDIYEELHSRYIQLYSSTMDLDKDHHTKFDLVMKKHQKMWDVGVRVGAAIRQQKIRKQSEWPERNQGEHNSPRPHVRRGHWHHFWTGPKTQPEERKLILKWLSPMTVAANPDDAPIVLHKVES